MELLIIFIITMVISSILRSFRGAGGRSSTSPAPRRSQSPLFPDVLNFPERNIEETTVGGLDFLEAPGYGRQENALGRGGPKQQKAIPKFIPERPLQQFPRSKKSVSARGVYDPQGKEQGFEENLRKLFSGENLPLGIIAAEIFSAPRARRPFGRK